MATSTPPTVPELVQTASKGRSLDYGAVVALTDHLNREATHSRRLKSSLNAVATALKKAKEPSVAENVLDIADALVKNCTNAVHVAFAKTLLDRVRKVALDYGKSSDAAAAFIRDKARVLIRSWAQAFEALPPHRQDPGYAPFSKVYAAMVKSKVVFPRQTGPVPVLTPGSPPGSDRHVPFSRMGLSSTVGPPASVPPRPSPFAPGRSPPGADRDVPLPSSGAGGAAAAAAAAVTATPSLYPSLGGDAPAAAAMPPAVTPAAGGPAYGSGGAAAPPSAASVASPAHGGMPAHTPPARRSPSPAGRRGTGAAAAAAATPIDGASDTPVDVGALKLRVQLASEMLSAERDPGGNDLLSDLLTSIKADRPKLHAFIQRSVESTTAGSDANAERAFQLLGELDRLQALEDAAASGVPLPPPPPATSGAPAVATLSPVTMPVAQPPSAALAEQQAPAPALEPAPPARVPSPVVPAPASGAAAGASPRPSAPPATPMPHAAVATDAAAGSTDWVASRPTPMLPSHSHDPESADPQPVVPTPAPSVTAPATTAAANAPTAAAPPAVPSKEASAGGGSDAGGPPAAPQPATATATTSAVETAATTEAVATPVEVVPSPVHAAAATDDDDDDSEDPMLSFFDLPPKPDTDSPRTNDDRTAAATSAVAAAAADPFDIFNTAVGVTSTLPPRDPRPRGASSGAGSGAGSGSGSGSGLAVARAAGMATPNLLELTPKPSTDAAVQDRLLELNSEVKQASSQLADMRNAIMATMAGASKELDALVTTVQSLPKPTPAADAPAAVGPDLATQLADEALKNMELEGALKAAQNAVAQKDATIAILTAEVQRLQALVEERSKPPTSPVQTSGRVAV